MEKIDLDKTKYLVCQPELAPTTQKLHIQGFLVATSSIRLAGVKKILGNNSAHVEIANGTPEQVRAESVGENAEDLLSACGPRADRRAERIAKLYRRIAPTVLRTSLECKDASLSSTATSRLRLPDREIGA